MTDGMVTRARTVDEQLSSMAEQLARHDAVITKIDTLYSTVQHYSDSFEILWKSNSESLDILRSSLAAQQTVMAEMMVKLQHLDKPSSHFPASQPPLLPFPPSNSNPPIHHSFPLTPASLHTTSSSLTPKLPKIEVPFFSGEYVIGWIFQINHYFIFNKIPEDQRVTIAAFYMVGPAHQWFQWLHSIDQLAQ
ncbi:hypothetical protein IHE45_11G012800 [Dioscorea alata]|uniref:Uncharacterized protein n=1 Tax=Dioscorea alata TaxID=55571 RepID=A0ACB7V4X2_DIOAL|nr:hypothetical protein IHE45_11G012800 [Dioscorea alata]